MPNVVPCCIPSPVLLLCNNWPYNHLMARPVSPLLEAWQTFCPLHQRVQRKRCQLTKMPCPYFYLDLDSLPWHPATRMGGSQAAAWRGHVWGLRQTAGINGPHVRDECSGEPSNRIRVFPGLQATPADAVWSRSKFSFLSPAIMAGL